MKQKIFFLFYSTICLLWMSNQLYGQCVQSYAPCENRALHFDGDGDYITLNPSPLIGDANFTAEAWFMATGSSAGDCMSSNCYGNFRRLFNFGGSGTRLEIGECNGLLNIFWSNSSGIFGPFEMSNTDCVRDGNWHCITVVRDGGNLEVFLDANSIYTTTFLVPQNFTYFRLGHWSGTAFGQSWLGLVDEVKLWDIPLNQISLDKHCLHSGNESNLVAYWQLDQYEADEDNSSCPRQADDTTPNGNDGVLSSGLNGFNLNGPTSNFVCSGAELVYPDFNNLDLEIRNYPIANVLVSEICDGDPVIFSLTENGNSPPPAGSSGVPVIWEVYDGSAWISLNDPPFSHYSFSVPPGVLTLDCMTSTDGFVDRKYRAITTVTDPTLNETCEYISDEYDLRICCPISDATVVISPDNLCEETLTTINISLNSPDLFVMNPGPPTEINIKWSFNGNYIPFDDQVNFNYIFNTVPVVTNPTNLCFEAQISNCAGKMRSFQGCFNVDPEPKCKRITEFSTNLTLVSSNPQLEVYSICPGQDARIRMKQPFEDCNAIWQYSFDGSTWIDEGSISNTELNTNELPWDFNWQSGATSIYYRIQCNPLSDPSGCDPCFSENMIEIQLIQPPPPDFIVGTNQECKENLPTLLTVNAYDSDYSYTWFCDGLEVGNGEFLNADKAACYWVEISNDCQIIVSPEHCLEVCEVIPIISCPLALNECAFLGDSISITACDSEFNCVDNSNLNYSWSYTDQFGFPQAPTSCTISDIPPVAGTTYSVTITNPLTGCTAVGSTTVVPCDNQ